MKTSNLLKFLNFSTIFFLCLTFANCENKKKAALPLWSFALLGDGNTDIGSSPASNSLNPSSSGNSDVNANQAISSPNLTVIVEGSSLTDPFTYETVRSYEVNALVVDSNDNPIPNALVLVRVLDPQANESALVYQQVTNSEGRVNGTLSVNQYIEQVEVAAVVGGETYKVLVPLVITTPKEDGSTVNTPVKAIVKIIVPIVFNSQPQIVDSDGDGVPDENDFYPNDPSKATKLRFPSEGAYTVAYEDLFPVAGDADLNDYVVLLSNEEDLNAKGDIVEIRGIYKHIAKGAGYKHTLNLRLPRSASITLTSVIYDENGNDTHTGRTNYTPSLQEMEDGIQILGDSLTTIPSDQHPFFRNIDPNQSFKNGYKAEITIRFESPINRSELGNSPYDLFIRILSKPIDSSYPASAPRATSASLQYYEVHFPKLYFDLNGKDIYLDNQGFPWAILIPKIWAWPLESLDIRGSSTAYPKFKTWMESRGELEKDWYLFPDTRYIYPVPSSLSL